MKKIISLLLAVMLVISAVPMAYAADTQDYSLGTAVKYTAANNENYTITVPAKLAPGQGGTVTLDGFWASNTVVTVTAEENVVLTNSINANDKKTLDVYFDGISEAGDNNGKQTFTAPVSVADIEAALFGTWNGQFNYTVGRSEGSGGSTGGDSGTTEPSDPDTGNEEITFTYKNGQSFKAYPGETWGEWIERDDTGLAKFMTISAENTILMDGVHLLVNDQNERQYTDTVIVDGMTYLWEEDFDTNLITFTIDGTEYQAEEGTTWEEYINSGESNSLLGLRTATDPDGVFVCDSTWTTLRDADGNKVLATATILDGASYVLENL